MKNKSILPDENKIAKGATNVNRPAFPSDFNYGDNDFTGAPVIVHKTSFGFTKHELGAFMIAQGLVAKYNLKTPEDQDIIADLSYQLAETILSKFK